MRIEKVNDHQIRCTLTGADLANRELKISELAYGSEKAKNLFRDMMQQANFEFGFDAEDIPLMIEAIPVNADCIVLIITKVEDPDEIDTRFSNFAPGASDEDDDEDILSALSSDIADDVLDLFHKIKNSAHGALAQSPVHSSAEAQTQDDASTVIPRVLISRQLSDLCRFAHNVSGFYTEPNSLYKNTFDGSYQLVISMGEMTTEQFGRILNLASEYGTLDKAGASKQAFMEEHYTLLIPDKAVQSLSRI